MIPAVLAYGLVSIYGIGSQLGPFQGINAGAGSLFGIIDQFAPYGHIKYSIGDSVMFNEKDIVCRLAYTNIAYTIVPEVKLIMNENPPT